MIDYLTTDEGLRLIFAVSVCTLVVIATFRDKPARVDRVLEWEDE